MKRILFAFFLFTAAATVATTMQANAQTLAVTAASFTAKVDLMDSYIGAGNMAAAQATWNEIHEMEKSVLAKTKASIYGSTTTADKENYNTILRNQVSIYKAIWTLKTDLATNRAAIHTKLQEFDLTIY